MTTLFDLPFEDAGPEPVPAGAPRRIRSVSELTTELREVLERTFGEMWVEGEISNCRQWNTGHFYFTLKDAGAQIRAVMFRSARRYLRFQPEDGLHVLARGRITVYEPKGEYQLVCEHLEPHGVGARQLAFEQLRQRLHAEGLFDPARKRPLPALPRKIGIVTSLDGAAIRDIVTVLERRYPNAHLVIRPTRVQGEGAAAEIARSVNGLALVPGVDVIIVGRGGGSAEDLWAFNEEAVARAIAASPVPVISAIGHEVDITIADFVADVRAPTPSAAAEIVVARKDDFCARVNRLQERLAVSVHGRIDRLRGRVHQLTARPVMAAWPARLAMRARHAAELTHDLRGAARAVCAQRLRDLERLHTELESVNLERRLGALRATLVSGDARLRAAVLRRHHGADARLRTSAGRLDSLSPLAVLARGYAVCWNESRTAIVRHAAAVTLGQRVRVTLQDGELGCEVYQTSPGTGSRGSGTG